MLSHEEADRFAALALCREGRESSFWRSEMAQVVSGLNAVALDSVRAIDVSALINRTGHLIWFEVHGLDTRIPLDIACLNRLRYGFRADVLELLELEAAQLTPETYSILSRLQSMSAFAALVVLKHFQIEVLISSCLASLTEKGRDLKALLPPRQRDLLEECRIEAVRVETVLTVVEEAVCDSTHPRHDEARNWLAANHHHGDLISFRKEVTRARDRLIALWHELCGRVAGVRASQLEPGQPIWFNLSDGGPGAMEWPQPEMLDYHKLEQAWSPRYFQAQLKHSLEERYAPQDCLSGLASLFLELEEKLEQAPRNDGPLYNALEFERRIGRISAWQYREELQKLEDHWAGLYLLYLEVFEELATLKHLHARIRLPELVEQRLDQYQAAGKPCPPILPDLNPVAEMEALLEDMELEEDCSFNRLMILYRQWLRQVATISPARHQLNPVKGLSAEALRQTGEQLGRFYRGAQRLDRLGVRLEYFLLTAMDQLNDWSPINAAYQALYLEMQQRNMLRCVFSCNHRALRAENYAVGLERAIREPDDIVPRLTMLSRLLSTRPPVSLLVSMMKGNLQERKQLFLMENSLACELQALRVQAEVRENLDGTEKRAARLQAFGLSVCDADRYQKVLDQYAAMASRCCQSQERNRLRAQVTRLQEQLIAMQRLCLPASRVRSAVTLLMERTLILKPVGEALLDDLSQCHRELVMVQEDAGALKEELRRQEALETGEKKESHPVLTATDIDEFIASHLLLEQTPLEKLEELAALSRTHRDALIDLFKRAREGDILITEEVRSCISERIYRLFKANGTISNMLRLCLLRHSPELAALELRLFPLLLECTHPELLKRQKLIVEVMDMFRLKERGIGVSEESLANLWQALRNVLEDYHPVSFPQNYQANRGFMIQWFEKLFRGTFV